MIDDDEAVRESLMALLSVAGYTVATFASAEAFLAYLDDEGWHGGCALLDVHMPGINGLDLLQMSMIRARTLPVLILTASPEGSLRSQALGLGAVDCLTKPVPEDILLRAIAEIRGNQELR